MMQQLFRLAGRVLPLLPPRVRWLLVLAGGCVASRVNRSGRLVATQNIGGLLGASPRSGVVRYIVRRMYRNHAANYVDLFLVPSRTREEMLQMTSVSGMEHLHAARASGTGAILATAHLGNTEYAGHALVTRGVPCAILTEPVEPAWLLEFFIKNREEFSAEVIPYRPGIFPTLTATLKRNVSLGIATDWDLQGTGVPVRCGHGRLLMPAGLAMLAIRTHAVILPTFGLRRADGTIAVSIEPPLNVQTTGRIKEDVQRISQAMADVLGRYLLRYPDQWWLFHPVWQTDYR